METGYTTIRRTLIIGDRNLELLILQPDYPVAVQLPGVLWLHGGGFRRGSASMVHNSQATRVAREGLGVVIAPEYRLTDEAPYPAALEDCYAALAFMQEYATELGIRSDQLFVGGESAGGGLAVSLCMLARDCGDIAIAYQMPNYPMIDCFDTESSRDNHGRVHNTEENHECWQGYLGELNALAAQGFAPIYASPARATDYSNLPPAYTFVLDGEPFYTETLTYVANLQEAGIEASCDVFHGDMHAFDLIQPWKKDSRMASRKFMEHYRYAMSHYFAPQPA